MPQPFGSAIDQWLALLAAVESNLSPSMPRWSSQFGIAARVAESRMSIRPITPKRSGYFCAASSTRSLRQPSNSGVTRIAACTPAAFISRSRSSFVNGSGLWGDGISGLVFGQGRSGVLLVQVWTCASTINIRFLRCQTRTCSALDSIHLDSRVLRDLSPFFEIALDDAGEFLRRAADRRGPHKSQVTQSINATQKTRLLQSSLAGRHFARPFRHQRLEIGLDLPLIEASRSVEGDDFRWRLGRNR